MPRKALDGPKRPTLMAAGVGWSLNPPRLPHGECGVGRRFIDQRDKALAAGWDRNKGSWNRNIIIHNIQ
jgi:hypothetical protein